MSDNKNSKGFNLDANLITQGDISIQGNLNVKGKTNTINQETLTVKDNLIAVNGGGVTLTTAQMAGVVAITGGQNLNLINNTYFFDTDKLCSMLKFRAEVVDSYDSGYEVYTSYRLIAEDPVLNEKIVNAVNSLSPYYFWDEFSSGMVQSFYMNNYHNYITDLYNYGFITVGMLMTSSYYSMELGIGNVDSSDLSVNISGMGKLKVDFVNQTIAESHFDILSQLITKDNGEPITKDDCTISGAAYAAPIYDARVDEVRIGLGSYEKDGDGNITDFTFSAGQGQAIATRSSSIENNKLVKWNNTKKILEQVPVTAVDNKVTVDGELSVNNLQVKDNIVTINTNGSPVAAQSGVVISDGVENYKLVDGTYLMDGRLLHNYLGVSAVYDETIEGYMGNHMRMEWDEELVTKVQSVLYELYPSYVSMPYMFTDYYTTEGTPAPRGIEIMANDYECRVEIRTVEGI